MHRPHHPSHPQCNTPGYPGESNPQTISEDSRNTANYRGHTHEIERATTEQAGIVKLNNTLTSEAVHEALTAAKGKELADRIHDLTQESQNEEINRRLEAALGYLSTRYNAAYPTYARALSRVSVLPNNALVYVVNDPDETKNGLYYVDALSLIKAPFDALSTAFTTDAMRVFQSIMTEAPYTELTYNGVGTYSVSTIKAIVEEFKIEKEEKYLEMFDRADAGIDTLIRNGMVRGFETEALLKQWQPPYTGARAKADDTKRVWRWELTSDEGVLPVTGVWINTGLSELDQAKAFTEIFLNRGNVDAVAIKSLTAIGYYYVTNATDFPANYGKTVGFVYVRKQGSHTITELVDRYDPTRTFKCINFGDWFTDVSPTDTFINRGNLDGVAIKSLNQIGSYHVANATDFPENFGRTVGVVEVTRAGSHIIVRLIDRYNPTRTFLSVGGGDWIPDLVNKGNFVNGEILKIATEGTYYATDCTDFPANFGRTVGMVEVKQHGSNRVTVLQDRYDPSRIFYSVNGAAWSSSLSAMQTLKNGGNLDGVPVKTMTEMGTWFLTNGVDLPTDYDKAFGFIRIQRFGSHYLRELIDRDDPSTRFVQVNVGDWKRLSLGGGGSGAGGGATIDIDPTQLPTSELLTDTADVADVFYNGGGILKVRQKEFDPDYLRSNASYVVSERLNTVYAFYDQLVTDFPQWVSRNQLGTEATGLPIYEYVIQPYGIGKMASSPASINNFKDILIRTGEHGQEMTAITTVMLFFKEMLYNERSDALYGLLRSAFRFRITPCSNPWGVNNANRRNSLGVDLNRNYDFDWANADGDKGSAPNSELESKAHIAWVNLHKANTLVQLNIHDHSDAALTWGTADRVWTQELLFKSFQRFGAWYRQGFTDPTPDVPVSWLGQPRAGYSDGYVGNVLDVPTVLFECPYINHPKFGTNNTMLVVRKTSMQILKEVLQSLHTRYMLG